MSINEFRDKYFFLSNFYPANIVGTDGIKYPSSEHAYQASKTHDINDRIKISKLDSPGKSKRYGRKLVLRNKFEIHKVVIMKSIVIRKFVQNPNLISRLLETGDEELIEGNDWGDTFWGVCNGIGENMLGKILMEIRNSFLKGLYVTPPPQDC
jgi:ribA/ribD-fused uncharacterized protein